MKISFLKIHGLGNDFVVINELNKVQVPEKQKAKFAEKYCNRRFFIGADGILFVQKSSKANIRMRIFNPDGSEAENCVNGLRCVSFAYSLWNQTKPKNFSIEVAKGIVQVRLLKVSKTNAEVELTYLGKAEVEFEGKIQAHHLNYPFVFVNVGNPHAVIFTQKPVSELDLEKEGHDIEYSSQFKPARTNTEFVNVVSKTKVNMRVHERGACETQACGSGSIAIVLAGINKNILTKNKWIEVQQPGGSLFIKVNETVLLKGPAELVFSGVLDW
ncbi:MAG: diaminopimelate epimerase [Candidatus Diapherotrites archaeon]|nr:diaminopimelate epimerase [Candidatus Diapherotrites archaeon]